MAERYDARIKSLNPKPETRNPEPATRNPEPGTRNPEPGTQNPEPGSRNPKRETRNAKRETWEPAMAERYDARIMLPVPICTAGREAGSGFRSFGYQGVRLRVEG